MCKAKFSHNESKVQVKRYFSQVVEVGPVCLRIKTIIFSPYTRYNLIGISHNTPGLSYRRPYRSVVRAQAKSQTFSSMCVIYDIDLYMCLSSTARTHSNSLILPPPSSLYSAIMKSCEHGEGLDM